ncbi:MAG: hydantoinase/oxoprolinase N-terminal domain-containing protein [Candidatus Bathyarchaeia archaeon]
MPLRIGIDVGGTHTDAIILDEKNRLIEAVKTGTTPDVTTGIMNSLMKVLKVSGVDPAEIKAAMFGTTHCTNAIVEREDLARTALIRVGRPGAEAIEPLVEWPRELREAIGDIKYLVHGGHEYTGEEIVPLDEAEIRVIAKELLEKKVEAVAVCSIFSPVNAEHEKRVAEMLGEVLGSNTPVTLSHEIGSIGLLERENSAVLNAAVVKVAGRAIEAFERAMVDAGIEGAEMYLSQNDGTLMSADYARKYPILTVASGPTNSIRGAAFLTGLTDGIVVDIGGTTTLVGVLVKGFPRESALAVEIGKVRTNFRMPDLIAIGCGGGTLVRRRDGAVEIGPQSVGYELIEKGVAWGGDTLTTTDIALAAGYASIDDPRCDPGRLKGLDENLVIGAVSKIVETLEESIDKIKTEPGPMPVVLVGGGGLLIPQERYGSIKGVSKVTRPPNYQYANALGAAIAQISGQIDKIYSLENTSREQVLKTARKAAVERAVNAGANSDTVEVVEIDEIALPYLPGNAVRIRVKAAGSLTL